MFDPLHRGSGLTLGRWHCTCPDPDWSPPEEVALHEMVVPLRGQWVRRRRGVEEVGNPAVVLFANPGDAYRVRHPRGVGDVCAVILLREEAVADLARTSGTPVRHGGDAAPSFPFGAGGLSQERYSALRALLIRMDRDEVDSVEAEEIVGWIATGVLEGARPGRRESVRASTRVRHERAVRRAEELLGASFREPLTLEEVARSAGYSPFHFARVFRAVTGLSVHGYLTRLRLRASLDALHAGEDDLSRLAHRVGFSSHSHFGEAFRRAFGRVPSRVRDDPAGQGPGAQPGG